MKNDPINNPLKFSHRKTYDGDWEVVMHHHKGGRKSHLERRICLCTHEDDAKCIADAMEQFEDSEPRIAVFEYWEKRNE